MAIVIKEKLKEECVCKGERSYGEKTMSSFLQTVVKVGVPIEGWSWEFGLHLSRDVAWRSDFRNQHIGNT